MLLQYFSYVLSCKVFIIIILYQIQNIENIFEIEDIYYVA